MPSISIIIPNHNGSKWLSRCIDSALSQDYSNFNIIIVDDASTDNSVSVIKKYQQKNTSIVLLQNSVNKGVSFSRNLGIRNSTAEYIGFLDSDDEVSTKWLSEIMYLIKKESLVVCGCWLKTMGSSTKNTTYKISKEYKNILSELWLIGGSIGGLVVKRSLCTSFPFDISKDFYEDKIFYNQLLRSSKNISTIQKSLYFYRRHSQNTTKNSDSNKVITYSPIDTIPLEYRHLSLKCITLGAKITPMNIIISMYFGVLTLTLKNYTLYIKLLTYYIYRDLFKK